ncbi:monocarboxylate transporter 10-like isoform X5 [Dermochelys coriacea]|uniref:monocarboxylate transporter 10-like isoform X5 n=1 Tax=Dermochelys coriacea TaxID=27794 RepID=UPI0018E89C5B|nr:monocarboxylate transporter 10-like isoform X5 [Dermochelys coriacea]
MQREVFGDFALISILFSCSSKSGLIMVSLYFTTKRSFATGIVMAGGAAGTLVQNQVHRYLINAFGWRTSLRVYCGILTICIFAGFAYRPLEKRRHPSVVENFQTSPLRGFIVDLSLWKDSIFELWVCALGLAKFGFFIPFVHMMKLAGDLGISLDDASYIMVGIGMSSLLSCLLFGKICDLENINRLYVNQASVLFVGLLYLTIPLCTTFPSLVAFGSLLGFFDAGNYVLLPVLTLDLMGAEKMPVAWGFMMAVHTISCFGPPFADTQKQSYLETIMFNFMNITCIYEPALESLKTPKTMIWRRVRREGFIGIFRHLCINKLYVFVCS